eukprot:COSAG06_NODE_6451_length_2925_cov_7.829087_3_plen_54_part_00
MVAVRACACAVLPAYCLKSPCDLQVHTYHRCVYTLIEVDGRCWVLGAGGRVRH